MAFVFCCKLLQFGSIATVIVRPPRCTLAGSPGSRIARWHSIHWLPRDVGNAGSDRNCESARCERFSRIKLLETGRQNQTGRILGTVRTLLQSGLTNLRFFRLDTDRHSGLSGPET